MTISLLRRIWKRIAFDIAAPPRQRLTGFEPLEPRMVLSGFSAYFTPDYLSPPPGDFSHIERYGAEIARPSAEFGGYSDYNSFDRGAPEAAQEFHAVHGWGNAVFDFPSPYALPLSSFESGSVGDSSPDITIISVAPTKTDDATIGYISISPLAVDSILTQLRAMGDSSGVSFNASFSPMTTLSTMSAMPSAARSLTDRDYNPVNSGGAVERHVDNHEIVALTHGSGVDAAAAVAARQATSAVERGALSAAANAALVNQVAGVNSNSAQTADGSTANGQANAASNSSSDRQQNGLLELTDAERLKLKRKLPDSTTETEEATDSTSDRAEQYDESDAQVAYDPTRPYNAVTIPEGSLGPVAGANLVDDGMIEILATDVTATLGSSDVNANAAANRQVAMEPAVATYQAFDIVADGDDSDAVEVAANAARMAAAIAMNAQPVVQAE